jgi:hypothetical protein
MLSGPSCFICRPPVEAGRSFDLLSTQPNTKALFAFPSKPQLSGRANLQASYTKFFAGAPQLHRNLISRTVLGNKVIDHERISGLPDGKPCKPWPVTRS